MSNKAFEFAIVLRITADSYDEALLTAKSISDFIADDVAESDDGIEVRLETELQRDGSELDQRVLYLHNENKPIILE